MKKKVIKNPRSKKTFTVVGGTGHTVATFPTLRQAREYAKLHPAYSVKGYKRNTAKPVAKANPLNLRKYTISNEEIRRLQEDLQYRKNRLREYKEDAYFVTHNKADIKRLERDIELKSQYLRQVKAAKNPVAKANIARKYKQKEYRVTGYVPSTRENTEVTIKALSAKEALSHARSKVGQFGDDKIKWLKAVLHKGYAPSHRMQRLEKRNPIQRRSNSSREQFNVEKLDDITREFQGREPNGTKVHSVGSDYSPNVLTRLGQAKMMIIQNGKQKMQIDFDGGRAWVAADARRNLYVEGKDAAIKNVELPKKGNLTSLGVMTQLDYLDKKDHIENGELVHYYHKLGEVDKIKPNAFLDHDGYILIYGGNYDILPEGIAN